MLEDFTHRPNTNDCEWNESYYFTFYTREYSLRGMTRIGFKPNKQEGMSFFLLFLPDGSAAAYQAKERMQDYGVNQTLRVGSMAHQRFSDRTWRYSFKDNMVVVKNPRDFINVKEHPEMISQILPVQMNLSYIPHSKVYEYSEHMTPESLELGKKSGDEHWEQIGIINGEIKVGTKTYAIMRMMGQRDHTHGIRDWANVGNWLYYVIWFSEELAVNPAAIVADDGRISAAGFLYKNGENIPIKSIRIIEQRFESEIFPISSKLEITDGQGKIHLLKGEAEAGIPIPFVDEKGKQAILTQAFGKFELDGVSNGYGTFETLRKVEKKR